MELVPGPRVKGSRNQDRDVLRVDVAVRQDLIRAAVQRHDLVEDARMRVVVEVDQDPRAGGHGSNLAGKGGAARRMGLASRGSPVRSFT